MYSSLWLLARVQLWADPINLVGVGGGVGREKGGRKGGGGGGRPQMSSRTLSWDVEIKQP